MSRIDPKHIHSGYRAVVIGGSAGSFQGIVQILSALTPQFPLPVILALHRLKHVRNGFVEALSIKSQIPIVEPEDKQPLKRGMAYLAPANYHLLIEPGQTVALSTEDPYHNSRPSIDLCMWSASYAYRERLVGILLSGANRDGAEGMKAIKARGGLTVVQDPTQSLMTTMPLAALEVTPIDYRLNFTEIVNLLQTIQKAYL